MNKYCKGKRIIYATERAFEVIYKDQGFKLVKEKPKDDESDKDNESTSNKEQENDEK
ncbi:hypothetical protein [Clostridium tetani]|uniref:hypothetical protein n=1 Tax=Clostridium tetani TaxID=1513 RepID=UPI000AFB66FB|nr:hypothetical protein [Clostridium tetani]